MIIFSAIGFAIRFRHDYAILTLWYGHYIFIIVTWMIIFWIIIYLITLPDPSSRLTNYHRSLHQFDRSIDYLHWYWASCCITLWFAFSRCHTGRYCRQLIAMIDDYVDYNISLHWLMAIFHVGWIFHTAIIAGLVMPLLLWLLFTHMIICLIIFISCHIYFEIITAYATQYAFILHITTFTHDIVLWYCFHYFSRYWILLFLAFHIVSHT